MAVADHHDPFAALLGDARGSSGPEAVLNVTFADGSAGRARYIPDGEPATVPPGTQAVAGDRIELYVPDYEPPTGDAWLRTPNGTLLTAVLARDLLEAPAHQRTDTLGAVLTAEQTEELVVWAGAHHR